MEPLEEKSLTNSDRNLNEENPLQGRKKNKVWIYLLIPVLLIAAVWIFKEIQISNIRKEASGVRQSLHKQATQHIVRTNEQQLRLLAKAFVWAIRSEMLQGNLSQVHLYLNEMVKEKDFKNVIVANDKGVIVSSTNKKFEGQPFSTVGNDSYLSANTTVINNTNDSLLVVSTPIMGFNNRLGTLMITYTIPQPTFK